MCVFHFSVLIVSIYLFNTFVLLLSLCYFRKYRSKFFTKYAKDAKITVPTVHGPNDGSNPGVEAELDIQYVMGVGRDIPTQFWLTAGKQPG